jgi:hypothetical protein
MAQPTTELLNTTLADLGSDLVLTHAQSLPLMSKLIQMKKVNKEAVGGTYIERSFAGGSPAKGVRINNGDEVANIQRISQTRKFQITSTRHFIPIFIPQVEADRNQGKQGVIKLIKAYPEMTVKEYWLDWEYWLLTAAYRDVAVSVIDTPGFDGSATLNGNYSGAANGLLDFTAPASQTETVQGQAKSNAISNVNQYGLVTSFASDGMTQIGKAYDRAAAYTTTGPDLGFADDLSYQNMVSFSSDSVRITDTDKPVFGAETRSFLPYKKAKVYNSINLDPTNASFSGASGYSTSDITGGVVYFVNSEDWEVPYYKMAVTPEFRDDIPNQDALLGKMVIDMGPICLRFNTQAVIGGTRIP